MVFLWFSYGLGYPLSSFACLFPEPSEMFRVLSCRLVDSHWSFGRSWVIAWSLTAIEHWPRPPFMYMYVRVYIYIYVYIYIHLYVTMGLQDTWVGIICFKTPITCWDFCCSGVGKNMWVATMCVSFTVDPGLLLRRQTARLGRRPTYWEDLVGSMGWFRGTSAGQPTICWEKPWKNRFRFSRLNQDRFFVARLWYE